MKSFGAAYLNMLKTSIGSGVLSFPYLFKTYGIIPTIFLTIVTGLFATYGLVLLTICSQIHGRSADFNKIARHSIPYSSFLVNLSVFAKCFGVSTSYVIITRDLIPDILKGMDIKSKFFSLPQVNLFIFLSVIGPFTYFSKLDKLKYTSFIGVFSIVLVIFAALYRYLMMTATTAKVYLFLPFTRDWITSLGKFIFSFTCHQNIFAVNAELENNSLNSMKKLIASVSGSSFCLYISFGVINYFIYGSSVSNNILTTYPNDKLATFVKILYVIVMGVSYPLQMAPARTYFLNLSGIHTGIKHLKVAQFIITTSLIALTYSIGISGVKLGLVYSLVGATASCFMCLIFPALFYLYQDQDKTLLSTVISFCSFLTGIFIFISTITSLLINNQH